MYRSLLWRAAQQSALLAGVKHQNHCSLVGVAHDIQTGYIGDDPVTQFTLTANVHASAELFGLANGAGDSKAGSSAESEATLSKTSLRVPSKGRFVSSVPFEKETYAVRCVGVQLSAEARQSVGEGYVVHVTGAVKHNSQIDQGKQRWFPYLLVSNINGGKLQVLQGTRKRAVLDAAQKSAEATLADVAAASKTSSVVIPGR